MEDDFQIFFSFRERSMYTLCSLFEVVGKALRLVYCEFNAYNTRRLCRIYTNFWDVILSKYSGYSSIQAIYTCSQDDQV